MKQSSLLLLFLGICLNLTAQQSTLDSLLESTPDTRDTVHYEHLIKIANELNKTDRQKSLSYYYQALKIAEDLNDVPRLGHINKFIGANHLYLSHNDSSRTFLEKSNEYFKEAGNDLGIIANTTNLALIHQRKNETEKAVELYHKVITDSENIEEWIEVIFAKINLASVLINQEDFEKSLNYLNSIDSDYDKFVNKLEDKIRSISDKRISAKELDKLVQEDADYQFIKSNYPSIYINQGISYRRLQQSESAEEYLKKAIEASGSTPYVEAYAYNNLGGLYQEKNKLFDALVNYQNGLKAFNSINNSRGQILSLGNIGALQMRLKNYSAADTSLRRAIFLSNKIGFITEERDGHKFLAQTFEARKKLDSAYVHHKIYVALKDSINDKDRTDVIQKWEIKYETEKEREEVARLALENEFKTRSQRNQSILFIVGILGLLGLGLYGYTRYRLKKEREAAEYERETNQAMAKFVPMEFVKTLGKENIKDVALGDEVEKEVTVLFSDIRNFSSMSERMTPIENFRFVKKYVERMSPIVHSNGGFINQYLGDGIMAIFQNDPDDALKACIEMQHATELFNKELHIINQDPIRVGMGIHTGHLVMGIIGDENRQDAAIISDTVNSAARMESLTKSYGNKIVLSKSSIDRMKNVEQFNLRGLGQAMVKGKSQPLDIYECYDADSPDLQSQKTASSALFEKAVRNYYERDFKSAQSLFEEIFKENPDDLVAYSFIKRLKNLESGVPESTIPDANYN